MNTNYTNRFQRDVMIGFEGYDPAEIKSSVLMQPNEEEVILIECDCGCHLLRVQSSIEYHDNGRRFNQDYYLAMFNYGQYRDSIWRRIVIAFKYLRSGKMFGDQLSLSPDEARKLSGFLAKTLKEEMPEPLLNRITEPQKDNNKTSDL